MGEGEYLDLEVYLASNLPNPGQLRLPRRARQAIGASYPSKQQGGELPAGTRKADETVIYLKVAQNLHVYLVRARPFKGTFPPGTELAYELFSVELTGAPSEAQKLARRGFCEHLYDVGRAATAASWKPPVHLRGYSDDPAASKDPSPSRVILPFSAQWRPEVLVQREARRGCDSRHYRPLPTFVLQKPSEPLRVWAGSCLKPHGEGESATTLMYASGQRHGGRPSLLQQALGGSASRPHALFQLGDQMYADDVSFLLFEGVKELGKMLLGGVAEKLPKPDGRALGALTARARHALVADGNTATPLALDDEVHNQLFGIGEFCAYYLMLFNPALWPDLEVARTQAQRTIMSVDWIPGRRERRLTREYEALVRSRDAIRDYATVMANVPSYAICDDHEVTDDWFFDDAWIAQVRESPNARSRSDGRPQVSPIGQYLVANAMYAYAVFQGLGNDPARVSGRLASAGLPDDASYAGVLSSMLGKDWSFTTPTWPAAFFLDTRTQRSGEGNAEYRPARTVFEYSIRQVPDDVRDMPRMMMVDPAALRTSLRDAARSGGNLFLVTPSPLLASDGIERKKRMKRMLGASPAAIDEELWRSNYSNYFMVVEEMRRAGIHSCVNLSGDVHYGYRRRAMVSDASTHEEAFRRKLKVPPQQSPFLQIEQLVCSPLLNRFDETYMGLAPVAQRSGFRADYEAARRFTRAMGHVPIPSNAWIVDLPTSPRRLVAQPAFVEQTEPIPSRCSDGRNELDFIPDNHFVEFTLRSDSTVEAVFHVMRSN